MPERETLRVVPAAPELAEEMSALARRSKGHWGYPQSWLEIWRPQLTLSPDDVRSGEAQAAFVGRRLAGFYVLAFGEGSASLEHFWVDPGWMGRGIGRALLEHAVERARMRGAAHLEVESDPNAQGFYLHHGAVRVGAVPAPVEGQDRELPLLRIDLTGSR